MAHERNIAIQLTPAGGAAIAVIRLTGPGVIQFLKDHFSRTVLPRRCVHGELRDGERVVDDALVVLCDEWTADLNIHGGPWVTRSVLELSRRNGFEVIDRPPLPLPPNAIDAESDLEAEVLTYLPLARTELGVRVLLAQERAWGALKERSRLSSSVAGEMEAILADFTLTHLLYPPTVAIVGAANVGKSTLANQLFAQQRSITADIPGTTRDWVGEIANIDGLPVMLLDTPGQRETADEIERTAINRATEQIDRALLVLLVLDSTRLLDAEQAALILKYPGALLILNKCDCSTVGPSFPNAVRTVATTGAGVDELRRQIVLFFCGQYPVAIDRPRCWTARQRQKLELSTAGLDALREM